MNKLFKMAGSLALAAVLTSGVVSPVYAEEQPVLTLEQAQAAEKETAETLERVEVELSVAIANKTQAPVDIQQAEAKRDKAEAELAKATRENDDTAAEKAKKDLDDAEEDIANLTAMLPILENSVKRAEENVAKAEAAHDAAVAALEKLTAQGNPEVNSEVNPEVNPEVKPEVNPEVKVNEKTADGRKAAVSTSVK